MHYSYVALKVLAAKEIGLIKSNAQFAADYPDQEKFEELTSQNTTLDAVSEAFEQQFAEGSNDEGFICVFDEMFPMINSNVKNSEKPHLLFYKGDITLLRDLNKNVAVIGLINPMPEIINREIEVVTRLVESDLIVISGLAKGCDTVAHQICVELDKKTIAILPSQLDKITPAANRNLAKDIVRGGGLLLTEYYKDPISRNDAIGRFVERDRLQAMFSKAVILIASYRKNEGDSGSRHAMEAAQNYEINRYVMYNEITDNDDMQFSLNKDFIQSPYCSVKVLNKTAIEDIKGLVNPNLIYDPNHISPKQLELY